MGNCQVALLYRAPADGGKVIHTREMLGNRGIGKLVERAVNGDSNAQVVLLLFSTVALAAVIYWVYRVIQYRRS
jgi:hypothetical protein